jgi:hypothetical protein
MGVSAKLRERLDGLAPWTGLAAAGLGWIAHQQVVTNALHFSCAATADGTGIALGVLALALVGGGAFVSWRALPARDATGAEAALRRFIVHLSLMASLLATLGLGFQILAGALLPGCRP